MQNVSTAPWFAEDGKRFTGNEPYFFNVDEFSWVPDLEANWEVIRDELLAMLENDNASLQPYPNAEMVSKKENWKTFGFAFWNMRSSSNCQKCPKTWDLLKNIPNLSTASFNLLEANTTIKPHHGDTNAIIRCHMGLVVPAEKPSCAFRVGTETKSWQEGKFFMFCDAHEHTAWNNTQGKRYILVVDIVRPEFKEKEKYISSAVLASINMAIFYQNSKLLNKFFDHKFGKKVIFIGLRCLIRLLMSLGFTQLKVNK